MVFEDVKDRIYAVEQKSVNDLQEGIMRVPEYQVPLTRLLERMRMRG